MKKNFIYLLLLCSLIAQAQITPSYPTIKLTKTVEGGKQDSLLVLGTDKIVKHIPLSKISNVREYATASALPVTGVAGKLYITKDNNKIYRWNGTFYHELAVTDISGLQAQIDLKANDSEVVKLTGNQTISGIKRFSENTVFGNAQIPGILPEYHLTEFNAPDNITPIAISGGTGVIEYWEKTEAPSYAWATGLRNPSVPLEPKDSFKFSVSVDAEPFEDKLEISDEGNLYTKGVLSENITTLTPTISGQPAIIKYVNSLNTTQPVKLVIYFHGAGTNQLNPFTDDSKIVIDALLSQGYIVAHSEAHGDNWGSQTAQDDYLDLYNYIASAYNLSDVIFVGHSMGGLASLNMIAKNTIPAVTKWYGVFPVTNLSEAYYTEGFSSPIEAAYGFSESANYAAATSGNDPNLYSGSAYVNRKYAMTASSGDVLIFKATNSDLINSKLTGSGIYSYIISATGNHGDKSHFIPKSIVSFVYDRIDTNKAIVSNGINVGIGTGLALPIKKLTVEDVDNQFALKARSTGNPTYQSWYTSASTRRGYFGYPSQGDSDLRLVNEESGGDIELMANEGDVKAYTANLVTSGNSTDPITNTITNASVVTGGAGAKYQFKFGDVETGYLWNFFDGDYFSTVLKSSGYLAFNTGGIQRFSISQTGHATFSSTVTASPATLSNHVVVKSQLDAVKPYKVYTFFIAQEGTANPVIINTFENTLGAITLSRVNNGTFTITSSGLFTTSKTFFQFNISGFASTSTFSTSFSNTNSSTITYYTLNNGTLADSIGDGIIEIRVYN